MKKGAPMPQPPPPPRALPKEVRTAPTHTGKTLASKIIKPVGSTG